MSLLQALGLKPTARMLASVNASTHAAAGTTPPAPAPDARASTAATGRPQNGKPAGPAPIAADSGLPKKARVIRLGMGRYQYDFGRPISQEQAAHVLFRDGKVPKQARLVQGPGDNSWTLRTFDEVGNQATLRQMRSRTQTVTDVKPNADGSFNLSDVVEEWDDAPGLAADGSKRPKREEPKKPGFGFKVLKHYVLDIGQLPHEQVRRRFGRGETPMGYQLLFEQAMTRDAAFDKLFRKGAAADDIILEPQGPEPAPMWEVKLLGAGAQGSLKRDVMGAFFFLPGQDSTAPGVPSGMQVHVENKTVPTDAVKHPPDVYVWEADHHLIRVETDGKGRYYTYETTKLHPTDEQGNNTMRYLMLEKGMRPQKAWEEYIKHWDEIHVAQLGAVATLAGVGVPRLPALPKGGQTRRNGASRNGAGEPGLGPAGGGAKPSEPAGATPGAGGSSRPGAGNGGSPNTRAGGAKTPRTPDPGVGTAPTSPAPPQRPAKGRPLDDTPPATGGPSTVGTDPPPSPPSGGGSKPRKLNDLTPKNLPSNQQITIKTADGPKQMTVGEYRLKAREAQRWVSAQRQENLSRGVKNHDHEALYRQAGEKFGLNRNWQYINNPYIY